MKITVEIDTAAAKLANCIARARAILDALDANAARMPEGGQTFAPRTIRIGNYDVPEPYRECLNTDQPYYIADPTLESFFTTFEWSDDEGDIEYYRRGLIHLTPEAAALHGKALASLTAGEGVEL